MKKIKMRNKITALATASSLLIAGSFSGVSFAESAPEDQTTYDIGICLSEDTEHERTMCSGFTDALADQLGAENLRVTRQTVNKSHGASAICEDYTTIGVDLIYTAGADSLSAASDATSTIPIVCSDVMDVAETLHLIPRDSGPWDKKTGMNITGISHTPDIESQLSLLIELNPELKSVGILFSPQDTQATYQNALLEELLDEAGIPWKEYELSSSKKKKKNSESAEPVIVIPDYTIAANAKEGANIDVDTFGEDGDLTGINSPNSARGAQISKNWTSAMNKAKKEPKNNKDRIRLACKECSCLYIAAGSSLGKDMKAIRKAASKKRIPTFGGDTELGKNTLTCQYADPYDEGYRAGTMACDILAEEEDPGSMTIASPSEEAVQKLYNEKLAKKYGRSFPKSFEPMKDFLKDYEPGERTERKTDDS